MDGRTAGKSKGTKGAWLRNAPSSSKPRSRSAAGSRGHEVAANRDGAISRAARPRAAYRPGKMTGIEEFTLDTSLAIARFFDCYNKIWTDHFPRCAARSHWLICNQLRFEGGDI